MRRSALGSWAESRYPRGRRPQPIHPPSVGRSLPESTSIEVSCSTNRGLPSAARHHAIGDARSGIPLRPRRLATTSPASASASGASMTRGRHPAPSRERGREARGAPSRRGRSDGRIAVSTTCCSSVRNVGSAQWMSSTTQTDRPVPFRHRSRASGGPPRRSRQRRTAPSTGRGSTRSVRRRLGSTTRLASLSRPTLRPIVRADPGGVADGLDHRPERRCRRHRRGIGR